jgi:malate permease and related proteins
VTRGVVVLESAMPVAVFNYLWAVRYDTAPEEVAGMVLGSTVLSFATLPLLLLAVM